MDSWKHLPSRKKEEAGPGRCPHLAREDWCWPVHLVSSRLGCSGALSRDAGRSVQGGATEGLGLTTKIKATAAGGQEWKLVLAGTLRPSPGSSAFRRHPRQSVAVVMGRTWWSWYCLSPQPLLLSVLCVVPAAPPESECICLISLCGA